MQRIVKGRAPGWLIKYQNWPEADWDRDVRGDEKQDAREVLCREQRLLCCFCERRIRPRVGSIKIAHFRPQAVDRTQMFRWSNLLGACLGGEGEPPAQQHCDTRQGSQELHAMLNPTQLAAGLIGFRSNGSITANVPAVDRELNEKLNLNRTRLRENRQAAVFEMQRRMESGAWTNADILREREQLTSAQVVEREEYYSYLIWWLDRRLRGR